MSTHEMKMCCGHKAVVEIDDKKAREYSSEELSTGVKIRKYVAGHIDDDACPCDKCTQKLNDEDVAVEMGIAGDICLRGTQRIKKFRDDVLASEKLVRARITLYESENDRKVLAQALELVPKNLKSNTKTLWWGYLQGRVPPAAVLMTSVNRIMQEKHKRLRLRFTLENKHAFYSVVQDKDKLIYRFNNGSESTKKRSMPLDEYLMRMV